MVLVLCIFTKSITVKHVVTIIFESHGTTFDNEAGLASGWFDVDLSPLGEQQARELGKRYAGNLPVVVFCSDLVRSWRTGEIAFVHTEAPIMRDVRLRECDYGTLTRSPSEVIDKMKSEYVQVPFPNGTSYQDMAMDMRSFLIEVLEKYSGKTVMVIGSRATQYGLEHWVNKVPLVEAVTAPWHWQPGWVYHLSRLE